MKSKNQGNNFKINGMDIYIDTFVLTMDHLPGLSKNDVNMIPFISARLSNFRRKEDIFNR